jgi:hypothetical protein
MLCISRVWMRAVLNKTTICWLYSHPHALSLPALISNDIHVIVWCYTSCILHLYTYNLLIHSLCLSPGQHSMMLLILFHSHVNNIIRHRSRSDRRSSKKQHSVLKAKGSERQRETSRRKERRDRRSPHPVPFHLSIPSFCSIDCELHQLTLVSWTHLRLPRSQASPESGAITGRDREG